MNSTLDGWAHRFFGCRGIVDREIDDAGVAWIGLRCGYCGKLKGRSLSGVQHTDAGRSALEVQQG